MRVLLLLFFLISAVGYAQNDTIVQKDLKIGLVLSGGGAKGFAHVGVLKVLEEAGVRIDYIGGTSMGAIVGALYSAGYSAHELDSIVRAHDFEVLMQDRLPREAKSIYQKENTEKYALSLPIINRAVGFPTALSKGQNVFNLLTKLTAGVSQINDFSKLPIPFYCMATNLETGAQEMLESGFLPEAIRASGAFPSLLDPVEIDGKLLTDGAVANNFPVEEMMAKGVDIIIGVDVQDKLSVKEELNSAPKILMQIVSFQMYDNLDIKRKVLDVYLHPDISDYSVVSFDKVDEIIEKGVIIAEEQQDFYKELASQQLKNDIVVERKTATKNVKNLSSEDFEIKGLKNYTKRFVLGKLGVRKEKTITYEDFEKGLDVLAATNGFQSIQYKFLNTGKVELKLKESAITNYLQIGAHFDDLFKTSALLNVTSKHLLFKNDIFSADLILGDNIRYNVDYYIDKGYYWSTGLKYSYTNFAKAIDFDFIRQFLEIPDIGINTIDVDYTDLNAQMYAETLLSQTFSVGLGAEYKRLSIISETFGQDANRAPRTIFDDSDYWSAFGYFKLDTYDNKYFPKTGLLFEGDIHSYLFSSDFTNTFNEFSIAKAQLGYAVPLSHNLAVHLSMEAGTKIGNASLNSLDFLLGGFGARTINNFIPFYGYDFLGITGRSFAKALVTFDYEIFKKNHINASANFANVGNKLFSTGRWFENPEFSGYALGYGLDTFAGPIQVKYSYSPELDQSIWFFSVGFWF